MHYEFGELNLLDPETHREPWALYTWLREECPIYRDSNGVWCISRYDDIVRVSRDPDTFTSSEGNRPLLPADGSFIHLEGDEHRQRRGLVSDKFTTSGVAAMTDGVRDAVVALFDALGDANECEFVEAVAGPLPVEIIGGMTGIPEHCLGMVRHWMDAFAIGGNGPEHVTEEVNEAFFSFGLMHMDLVEERKAEPKDDLLTLWINAKVNGAELDEDQLLFEHTMMMIGGGETSRNAITCALHMLAEHPEQRAWLREHPEGMDNAIEEILRWATPFVSMSRVLTRDVELLGQELKKGDTIKMLYPAANRDPRRFEDPERFDIRRSFKNKHLSFGFGRHFCVGAKLARLEVKLVLEEMFKRAPDWEIVDEPVWQHSSFLHGIKELNVRFHPEGGAS